MKKILVLGGILLGFFVGILVGKGRKGNDVIGTDSDKGSMPPVVRKMSSSDIGAEPVKHSSARNSERKDDKYSENSMYSERYKRLIGIIEKQKLSMPGIGFGDDFSPNKSVGELFDLNKGDQEELGLIGHESLKKVQKWELDHMKLTKSDDSGVVYEIPGDGEFSDRSKKEFKDNLQDVLGGEGLGLLSNGIDGLYRDLSQKRVLSYTISDRQDEDYKYEFKIERFDANGNSMGSSIRSGIVDKVNPASIPARYEHLFKIAGAKKEVSK